MVFLNSGGRPEGAYSALPNLLAGGRFVMENGKGRDCERIRKRERNEMGRKRRGDGRGGTRG